MSDIVKGLYGETELELDRDTGILKFGNKQGMLINIKRINILFGSIMKMPWFSMLLHTAGIDMGEDHTLNWLMEQKKKRLPQELREEEREYLYLRDEVESDAMNPASLSDERKALIRIQAARLSELAREVYGTLADWLSTIASADLQQFWQAMHDEDTEAGWGKAILVEFDSQEGRAKIEVISSFIGRLHYYWNQQNKMEQKVCSFLEGYFAGEARVLLHRDDLICREQKCRLKDAERCVFVIEPQAMLENPW